MFSWICRLNMTKMTILPKSLSDSMKFQSKTKENFFFIPEMKKKLP